MNVKIASYDDVLDYLQKERWDNGMEIVAYPIDGTGIDHTDLRVFANIEDAHSFLGNIESYDYTSIRSVINTMREGANDQSLRRYNNSCIDVGQMTEERLKRLDSGNKIEIKMETQTNKSKEQLLEDTINYNKESLKFMGFKGLDDEVEKGIRSGKEEFIVPYQGTIDGKNVNADLHFRNGETRTFWNSYDLTVTDSKNLESTKSNTLYLNKSGRGLSLKKAFNQLEGRAVYAQFTGEKTIDGQKTSTKYNAWEIALLQEPKVDGKYQPHKFNDNYGFNTIDALKALDKTYLMIEGTYKSLTVHNVEDEVTHQSLKTGNRQGIRVMIDGKQSTLYVEANPGERKLNAYMEKTGGKELTVVTERQKTKAEAQGKETTETAKEKKEQEKAKGQGEEESERKGKGQRK
jgi:hypothetical protein